MLVKAFFKGVRVVLGGIIVVGDKLFPPKSPTRPAAEQAQINEASKSLALYQFESCPFCIKVRRQSKRLGVPLTTRNILKNPEWQDELIEHGGKRKVPCLRIVEADGKVKWLYESKHINHYLSEEFAPI